MITLTIKKQDGSEYWKSYFNTLIDCNKWLNEEKTRPYWKQEYTWEIVDNSPTPEQIAQREAEYQALKLKKDSAIVELNKFDKTKMKTEDVAQLIEHILVLLGIK